MTGSGLFAVLGITVRTTGSINRSFDSKKGIPSMTSCDASGATLRTVGDLTLAVTGGRNYSFVKSSLEKHTDFFESALCNREGDAIGRGRKELGFRLTSFSDIRSQVEPQSTNPCAETWSSN